MLPLQLSYFSFFPTFLHSLSCHLNDRPITALNAMFTTTNITVDTALFILAIIPPSLILLITISLLVIRPSPLSSPPPVISATVSTGIPRRGLILSCLYLLSFIHLLDGLAFVIDALVKQCWRQRTGTLGVNSFTGLLASSGLAAVGTWKDIKGVEVWSLKRMKIVAYLSFILDVAQAVLYGASMHRGCAYIFPYIPHRNSTRCFIRPLSSSPISERLSNSASFFLANFAHSSSSPITARNHQSHHQRHCSHVF